mmetsp:Transcript_70719/g.194017  ORF Transcript_70719/g.194017 Transcript_70719/m.194017 type:complete len:200 (+) Transcript_70719:379-978(+)
MHVAQRAQRILKCAVRALGLAPTRPAGGYVPYESSFGAANLSKASSTLARLFSVATSRALLPIGVGASGSAPAASSGATTPIVPPRAARARGVQPPLPAAEWSAPWRRRTLSASAWPSIVAAWTQLLARPVSLEPREGSAPCCRSNSASSRLTPWWSSPKSSAACSAVRLLMSWMFGSAPCASSSATMSPLAPSLSTAI